MKVYTKTGDAGTTSLVGGTRVSKTSARLEAYGTVDELNSWLALLSAQLPAIQGPANAEMNTVRNAQTAMLNSLQHRLFDVGSELATEPQSKWQPTPFAAVHTRRLEEAIDAMEALLPRHNRFVLPGGSVMAANANIARTVARRAERRIVALAATETVNANITAFVNRLSDYLFVLGRFVNVFQGVEEVYWEPDNIAATADDRRKAAMAVLDAALPKGPGSGNFYSRTDSGHPDIRSITEGMFVALWEDKYICNVVGAPEFREDPFLAADLVWRQTRCQYGGNGHLPHVLLLAGEKGTTVADVAAMTKMTHADPRCSAAALVLVMALQRLIFKGQLPDNRSLVKAARAVDARAESWLALANAGRDADFGDPATETHDALKTMATALWTVRNATSIADGRALLDSVHAPDPATTAVTNALLAARFALPA